MPLSPAVTLGELRESLEAADPVGSIDSRRRIEASYIQDILNETGISSNNSLNLVNLLVVGQLNLSALQVAIPLRFTHCEFREGPVMNAAKLKALALNSCELPFLKARSVDVAASVSLIRSVAKGTVDLSNGRIRGDIDARFLQISGEADPAIFLRQARVDGAIDCTAVQARNNSRYVTVSLENAIVSGPVGLRGARITNSGSGTAVAADHLEIGGSLSLEEDAQIEAHSTNAALSVTGIKCRGAIIISGSTIMNHLGPAIRSVSSRIEQSLVIRDNTQLSGHGHQGTLRIVGSRIDGSLDIRDSKLENLNGPALSGDGIVIGTGGAVRDCAIVSKGHWGRLGAITIKGSNISSQFEFERNAVGAENGPAIALDQTRVAASLRISALHLFGSSRSGAIRIPGTEVGGQLLIAGIRSYGSTNQAVYASGVQVGGSLILIEIILQTTTEAPSCDFQSSQIKGQVDINRCSIDSLIGPALSFYGAEIKNSLQILRSKFSGSGTVIRLSAISVRDFILLDEVRVSRRNSSGVSIGLQMARVGGALRLDIERLIDLSAGLLQVDMDECQFRSAPLRDTSTSMWLKLFRDHTPWYTAQPYQQLADFYQRTGHSLASREVRIDQEHQRRRRGDMPYAAQIWHKIKSATIAYGYKSHRALAYIAAIWVLLATVVLTAGITYGSIDDTRYVTKSDCSVSSQLALITESALPIIGVGPRLHTCQIEETSIGGKVASYSVLLAKIVSWFFTSLFVAGYTGLVKRI